LGCGCKDWYSKCWMESIKNKLYLFCIPHGLFHFDQRVTITRMSAKITRKLVQAECKNHTQAANSHAGCQHYTHDVKITLVRVE
jgi:hypothetical protein